MSTKIFTQDIENLWLQSIPITNGSQDCDDTTSPLLPASAYYQYWGDPNTTPLGPNQRSSQHANWDSLGTPPSTIEDEEGIWGFLYASDISWTVTGYAVENCYYDTEAEAYKREWYFGYTKTIHNMYELIQPAFLHSLIPAIPGIIAMWRFITDENSNNLFIG